MEEEEVIVGEGARLVCVSYQVRAQKLYIEYGVSKHQFDLKVSGF